jgi:hypothetical protein
MPFVEGQSGNPAGRPIGARNRKTQLMELLLEGEGEGLTRRVIERAMAGDKTAMRLCIERLLPRGADRPVPFALPTIERAEDARRAITEIAAAVGTGALTPRESMDLLRVLEKIMQALLMAQAVEQAGQKAKGKIIRWRTLDGTYIGTWVLQPDGSYRSVGKDPLPDTENTTEPKYNEDTTPDGPP